MMNPTRNNAWTWLNWLEAIAALQPLLSTEQKVSIHIDQQTHGIKVFIDGVRVTMYGLNILEANQLATTRKSRTLTPEIITLLQGSLKTPEIHASLTDHPQQIILEHLDEVDMWQHLIPQDADEDDPEVILTPATLKSLHAIQRSAISQIVRGNEEILKAERLLSTAIGLTIALFAMSFFIPTQFLQVILYLFTALSGYRTVSIYNRKLHGIHELRKSEKNLKIGLEKHGFPA